MFHNSAVGSVYRKRITENREGYYRALRKANRAWEDGHLDVTAMEAYLAPLVQAQLENQDRMMNST